MRDIRFMIGGCPIFPTHFEGFADEIGDAVKRGLITPEQAYDVLLGASVIIKGMRESDEKPGYALAEATNFIVERDVAESDVIRAADFVSVLSEVAGAPVIAAAMGDSVSERDRRLAERAVSRCRCFGGRNKDGDTAPKSEETPRRAPGFLAPICDTIGARFEEIFAWQSNP